MLVIKTELISVIRNVEMATRKVRKTHLARSVTLVWSPNDRFVRLDRVERDGREQGSRRDPI